MLQLVEFRSLIDVFHPITQHAVDQSGQLGRHGFDRNRSSELGSQPTELRSVILLGGLLLNMVSDLWWADPVAGLIMVPIIVKEGVDGLCAKTCCD